jgi:hypothetical protein
MRYVKNEKGIALMMALILAFIGLAIISALVYLITQGTIVSGFKKRYQTALEASHSGTDLMTKQVIPDLIGSGNISADINTMQASLAEITLNFPVAPNCLQDKLLRPTFINNYGTFNWPNCGAANTSLDPTTAPDLTFTLLGVAPQPNFNVAAKIVDTVEGNSDRSGLELEGLGVAESGSGMITPKHTPYMYRIELQAQRAGTPDERANLSVLYAY